MKKIHFILILLIGVLLMPNSVLACGNNVEKTSCSKEMSSHKDMKDCCEKENSSKKDHSGCAGKCGNAMCSVSSIQLGVVSTLPVNLVADLFNFSTEKQKFYHTISLTSEGYTSIWLLPKIG